ncbi:hypothetical protein HKX48_001709 [Thoreauomyces humboldtii]|nr:hypothetical protein HKX48_001709 [Thoreauomyces humboldtii]
MPTATDGNIISYSDLIKALNSENVEALFAGLSAFNKSLARLVNGHVDHEISLEADLVRAYLKNSPEAAELFSIWGFQQKNQVDRIASVVLDVISRVILASKLVAVFSSGKDITIQCTLRLLAAVAAFNTSTAKELHDTFNFSMTALAKCLYTRGRSTDTSSRRTEDIRSLYIRFLLSFLEQGDGVVKKFMLETKDLLGAIFKGMSEDSYEEVDYILSTLKRTVVDDASLKRTTKIAFFNNYVLEQISRLYAVSTEPSSGDSIHTVADLAHSFILSTTTAPGKGTCFQDAGWYPAKAASGGKHIRVYNKVLLQLLTTLKPVEDTRQASLLLAALLNCPELVQPYWSELGSLSFEPRVSTNWLANMALVARVIQLPVPPLLGANELGLPPPPVDIVVDNILPAPLDRAISSRALQHSNTVIKHTMAVVLALAFEKLKSVQNAVAEMIRSMSTSAVQLAVLVGNVDDLLQKWYKFNNELVEGIRRRMPDLQIVLRMQNQLKHVSVEAVTDSAADVMEVDEVPGASTEEVSPETLHCSALRLLGHYQRHFPDTVLEARVNYGKLLPPDLTVLSLDLQLHLLDLITEVPEFNWKERAAGASGSHLGNIFRLFLKSGDNKIVAASVRALLRMLSDSFLFQQHPDELSTWLDTLRTTGVHEQDAVINWLDEALCTGGRTPYRVVDRLTELINNANEHMSEEDQRTAAHVSTSGSHSIVQDLIGEPYFPFSPALLCAADGLQVMMKREDQATTEKTALVARCFYKMIRSILDTTQGVENHLLRLVERVVGDGANTFDRNSPQNWDADSYLAAAIAYLQRSVKAGKQQGQAIKGLVELTAAIRTSFEKDPSKGCDALTSFLRTASPASLRGSLRELVGCCSSYPEAVSILLEELQVRHPVSGSIYTQYPDFWSTRAESETEEETSFLLTQVSTADLIANAFQTSLAIANAIQPAIEGRIQESSTPSQWMGWGRQLLRQLRNGRQANSARMAITLLETIMLRARHAGSQRDYDALRDLVFGHPFLVDAFLSERAEDAGIATFVIDVVHRTLSAETTGPTGEAAVWERYTDLICDKLLSEFALGSSQEATVRAFALFRQYMPASSLDAIMECLLQKDGQDTHVLLLALTAKAAGAKQVISGTLLGRIVELMQTGNDDVMPILLQVVKDHVTPGAVSEQSAAPTSRITVAHSDQLAAFLDVPAYFTDEALSSLLNTSDDEKLDVRAEIVRSLISVDVRTRNRVAKRLTEKLIIALPDRYLLVLLGSLIKAFTLSSPAAVDRRRTVTWIPAAGDATRAILTLLHGRLADSIRESIVSAATGTSKVQSALDADALVRLVILFGGYGTALLESIAAKAKQLGKLQDSQASCAWLKDHLEVLEACGETSGDALCSGLWILRSAFLKKVDLTDSPRNGLHSILAKRLENLARSSTTSIPVDVLKSFMVPAMKTQLADPAVLSLLTQLVSQFSMLGAWLPFTPEALCDMITTHSQFKVIVIPEEKEAEVQTESITALKTSPIPKRHAAKTSLLRLLVNVMKLDPQRCCKTEYLPALAQGYLGTMDSADRLTLEIFYVYEVKAGISVEAYVRHWGGAEGGEVAFTRISAWESLSKVDPTWMAHTCQWYAVVDDASQEDLTDPVAVASSSTRVYASHLTPLYDPSFFLPLIVDSLVLPEGQEHQEHHGVEARKLVESNALGLAVMALSSASDATRRAGYFILDMAYQALCRTEIKERNQIMLVLDGLRNAVVVRVDAMISKYATPRSGETQRVPSIMALFVAQTLRVVLKPDNQMYPLVNRFFLQRPVVDMEDIPMFYELFYSATDNSRKERVWMLRLLCSGLKSASDYRLYKRRHVLDILLGFYSSAMADTMTRKLVLELLVRAAAIPSVLSDMITQSSLLTFLSALCGTLDFNRQGSGADLTLGIMRLTKAILSGFRRTDPHWHSIRRGMWIDALATLVVALVQGSCRERVVEPETLLWRTTLCGEAASLIASLAVVTEEQDRRAPDAPSIAASSPIAAGHLLDVVRLWQSCISCLPADAAPSTVDTTVTGEASQDVDLDHLYAVVLACDVQESLRDTVMVIYASISRLPSPSTGHSAHTQTSTHLSRFLLDCIETEASIARDPLAVRSALVFLAKNLPPSQVPVDVVGRVAKLVAGLDAGGSRETNELRAVGDVIVAAYLGKGVKGGVKRRIEAV